MRRIIKASRQPASFGEWIEEHKDETGRPAAYLDIHKSPEVYRELKEVLIREQYFLCCYCCNSVSMASESSHIEHFIPRSIDPSKELDYHNLFISCNGYIGGISTAYRESCGHRKNNWYDEDHMVSPLDPECEDIFVFLFDGSIEPRDGDIRAVIMIQRFGLNSYALKKVRKSVIDLALRNIGYLDDVFDGLNDLKSGDGSASGVGLEGLENGCGLKNELPPEVPKVPPKTPPETNVMPHETPPEALNKAIQAELRFNTIPSSEGVLPPFCDAVTYILRELLAG